MCRQLQLPTRRSFRRAGKVVKLNYPFPFLSRPPRRPTKRPFRRRLHPRYHCNYRDRKFQSLAVTSVWADRRRRARAGGRGCPGEEGQGGARVPSILLLLRPDLSKTSVDSASDKELAALGAKREILLSSAVFPVLILLAHAIPYGWLPCT